jgi:photosystem II stability/assembly factor-like uncharacterized protein
MRSLFAFAPFASLLTLSLAAQDVGYQSPHWVEYKRFTRGRNQPVADDALGRLEWWRERMGGDLGQDFMARLLREAERERAAYPQRFPGPRRILEGAALLAGAPTGSPDVPWVSLGPTSSTFTQNGLKLTKVDAGRLRTILVDPADASGNTVYLLASGGGLWKTTSFTAPQATWVAKTDFVGSDLSGAAAFGRSSSTLYVGAGDPFDVGMGGFMVKSTDGGDTWSSPFLLPGASTAQGVQGLKILDIKVEPSQGLDIVLVGTDAGLFRSPDGGQTYTKVPSLPGPQVWSLAPTSAGWLATCDTNTSPHTSSIYVSRDQGATWSAISNAGGVYTNVGRTTLGVGQPGDSIVYAYAANPAENAQGDLFRSADGGLTWKALGLASKAIPVQTDQQKDLNLMGKQAWYNQMILVDPTDSTRNTVYLGGQYCSAKSTDGGVTWAILTEWLGRSGLPYVHADFHCAAAATLGGQSRIYFGTDGGIFVSANGGATFDDTRNVGVVSHLLYTLTASPASPGRFLTGLQDNGTRLRETSASSVFNQVRGGDGFGVAWSQANNATALSAYTYGDIQRSTQNPPEDQSRWSDYQAGLTGVGDANTTYFVTPLYAPPASADPTGTVFYTYDKVGGIFRANGSAGWARIATQGQGGLGPTRIVRSVSHGIGVSPLDPGTIAAAGSGGYVLVSQTGGNSWQEVYLGAYVAPTPDPNARVPGWTGYNANVAWASNDLLYVCSESPLAGSPRVARSADVGLTWTNATGNLPDVPVTKLAVDPLDPSGNRVYAATFLGVYRTTNGGASWQLLGRGLPQMRVTDLYLDPGGLSLAAATWGRGIWQIPLRFDLDGNGAQEPLDLLLFAKYYGAQTATNPGAAICDLDGNGRVDDLDLAIFLSSAK